ncbi:MAG: CS1-pili formation C-terminal domain-containing protein [Sphingomicrobium sp.]
MLADGEGVDGSTGLRMSVGAPAGFDSLSGPREILADIFFGGSKVGEATIVTRSGTITFKDPSALTSLIPNLKEPEQAKAAFARELPGNPALVCSDLNASRCGTLAPEDVGVIFDEEHFRVDVFVNLRMLNAISPVSSTFLRTPSTPLSLTNSMSLTLSGSSASKAAYNLQNRTLVGYRNARIRSDSSYSSELGLIVDDLVAEVDRPDLRYSAGLFWVPGLDLIGQRRIVGAGVSTQLDTRSNKELIQGTPVYLFLQQPARVEMLIDGRLVESRFYEAGNNQIDTSRLPDGSYSLLLRIHEAAGTREERRFFARNAQIAPVGRPIYFAFAGLLANTRRNRPISPSKDIFYEAGTAHRLSRNLAVDATIIGTQHKTILESGAFVISPLVRVRAAGLVSSKGDRGALVQFGSAGGGRLNFSFDLRRIWSRDGGPLMPLPMYGTSFEYNAPTNAQMGSGSYTQASGNIGASFGSAYVSLTGSLRRDKGIKSDYVVGPSLSWPVVTRGGFQVVLQADAQKTRHTTAAFAGLRLLTTSRGRSLMGSMGYASRSDGDGSRTRLVGRVGGEYFHEGADRTQIDVSGGIERTLETTAAQANGAFQSRFGSVRGDLLHRFDGQRSTQYGLTLQSGAALTPGSVAVGGRDLQESAIIASVDGGAKGAAFEVLINDTVRGVVKDGDRLPIFLQPYRVYRVRLKPVKAAAVAYDSAAREFTLYPGNVQPVRWHVERTFTVFGRAVGPDGVAIADARVESRHGLGQTDTDGYFQVDVAGGDLLSLSRADHDACQVSVTNAKPNNDYASLGKVVCQ